MKGAMKFLITAAMALSGLSAAHAANGTDPCVESPSGQNIRIGIPSSGPHAGTAVFNRNGVEWMPRGLQIRGFVSSIATAQFLQATQGIGQQTIDAQNIYGTAELTAAWQKFGANMLRFQVSQHDLDSQDDRSGGMPAYDPAYKTTVINAINLARSKCFVVIISMQAEKRSGVISRKTLPYAGTKRAWQNLLSGTTGQALAADRGILLEVYNEPGGPNQQMSTALWQDWAHASQTTATFEPANSTNPNDKIFGAQPMIDFLRGSPNNSQNVLIVDGLKIADTFNQIDTIQNAVRDTSLGASTDQLAYGVHPYLRGRINEVDQDWNVRFGFLKNANPGNNRPAVPVLSTEWSAQEFDPDLGLGSATNSMPAVNLLNYLRIKNIPMGAGAMDIGAVLSQDPSGTNPPQWVPTNYDNFASNQCANSRNNAGLLVSKLFKTNYAQALVEADGKTAGQTTPIWCP